ncbi:MAG: hypothetical protein ACT4PO_16365 [Actinomycetota bacterium]
MSPEEFYPAEYTDASRRVLDQFLDDFQDAVLIGGWASWARIGVVQSHDIDVIVGPEVLSLIEKRYGPVTASTHMGGKKWRAEFERIHLDLYVPYQSRLGSRLKLRVEALPPHAERVDGWLLLALPAHLATKFAALLDRPDSEPGEKDRMEIWRLLQQDIAPDDVAGVLRASEASGLQVVAAVRDVFTFLADLQLDRAERQRLRGLSSAVVEALERVLAESEEQPSTPSQ